MHIKNGNVVPPGSFEELGAEQLCSMIWDARDLSRAASFALIPYAVKNTFFRRVIFRDGDREAKTKLARILLAADRVADKKRKAMLDDIVFYVEECREEALRLREGSTPRLPQERQLTDEKVFKDSISRPELFEILVKRWEKKFFSTAIRIVKDPRVAEDVVQQAFMNIIVNAARFRGNSAFGTWSYRIVTNAALNALRREKTYAGMVRGPTPSWMIRHGPGYGPSNPIFDKREQGEHILNINRVLAQMPEDQRRILVQRHFDQATYEDIAAKEHIVLGTVKSRLARARKRFKAIWDACT